MPSDVAYPTMSADEKKWQAESDARTLSEAEAIKLDEKRMDAAQKAAQRLQEEKQAEADGMRRVAKGQLAYNSKDMQKK